MELLYLFSQFEKSPIWSFTSACNNKCWCFEHTEEIILKCGILGRDHELKSSFNLRNRLILKSKRIRKTVSRTVGWKPLLLSVFTLPCATSLSYRFISPPPTESKRTTMTIISSHHWQTMDKIFQLLVTVMQAFWFHMGIICSFIFYDVW